jgi:hypothetical protein
MSGLFYLKEKAKKKQENRPCGLSYGNLIQKLMNGYYEQRKVLF